MVKNRNDKKKTKKDPMPIPKNAQSSLPYKECYENGVFQEYDGLFSKTYHFNDTTFKTLSQDGQETIYEAYQAFLNALASNDVLSFNFINTPEDPVAKLKKIAPEQKGDELDTFRTELTEILGDKVRNSKNSITSEKYFTYALTAKGVDEAMKRFIDIDEELLRNFKRMSKEGVSALTLDSRLELFHNIMNGTATNYLFEHDENGKTSINWKAVRKQGLTTKDLIAAPMKFNATNFMIGDRYGQALYLDNIANWLNTNFLAELTELSFESCIKVQIIPIPQEDAIKLIRNQGIAITSDVIEAQKRALKNGYDPSFISIDLKNAKAQIDELQEDMSNRDQKLFFFSLTMSHFADDPETLKEQKEVIRNIASKYLCGFKVLSMQQERGFFGSLPFGTNKTFTKRPLTTESLGIFMPFNEISRFDKGGYYYGVNAVNKTIIAYNRIGPDKQNYNGLILGAPGSGKSFSAKREIVNTVLNTNAQVYVVDPDGEYTELAREFGGSVIKIAPGNGVYLNPMDLDIDTTFDSDGNPISLKSDFIGGLLETMLGHNAQLTPVQKSIVDRCIIQIYADYLQALDALPPGPDGKKKTIDRSICPTLQNLFNMLLEQSQPEAHNLAIVMERYTTGSFDTFAHHTNVDVNARFIVYDIKDIGTNLRDLALKICLNDIWTRMVANRTKGLWTWAYVDEFHLLLSSPSSAEFLKSIWKRARKFWGVPTGITQNVEDLLLSPAARAIINTTSFVMMLNQSAIDRANLAELLNLSDGDLEHITNVDAGCGLLYTGKQTIPFKDVFPENTRLYKIMSTKAGEVA